MQTLDQSKIYYRRLTVLDVITFMMIIGCLFFTKGYLISLLLIVVYPFSHSKVLVSETRAGSDKFGFGRWIGIVIEKIIKLVYSHNIIHKSHLTLIK